LVLVELCSIADKLSKSTIPHIAGQAARMLNSSNKAWYIIIELIKREVRCKTGAIPVAVKRPPQTPPKEGLKKKL